jgi:NAD-dependent SIR2 family protein deacetylase
MDEDLICFQCQVKLEEQKTTFFYMNHWFYADIPRCPQCGQVYIDEALVRGRMSEVEITLEDK